MSNLTLPPWAEAAIGTMNAEALRPQLVQRWREIELDVIPHLAELRDVEKHQVFDCVLWAGKYWQKSDTTRQRKALSEAKVIRVGVTQLSF